jgi:hypothetical protein
MRERRLQSDVAPEGVADDRGRQEAGIRSTYENGSVGIGSSPNPGKSGATTS